MGQGIRLRTQSALEGLWDEAEGSELRVWSQGFMLSSVGFRLRGVKLSGNLKIGRNEKNNACACSVISACEVLRECIYAGMRKHTYMRLSLSYATASSQ